VFVLRIECTVLLQHLHVHLDVLSLPHLITVTELRQLQVESLRNRNLLVVLGSHVGRSIVPGYAASLDVLALYVGVALRLQWFGVALDEPIAR
jgi:hypothetical protein